MEQKDMRRDQFWAACARFWINLGAFLSFPIFVLATVLAYFEHQRCPEGASSNPDNNPLTDDNPNNCQSWNECIDDNTYECTSKDPNTGLLAFYYVLIVFSVIGVTVFLYSTKCLKAYNSCAEYIGMHSFRPFLITFLTAAITIPCLVIGIIIIIEGAQRCPSGSWKVSTHSRLYNPNDCAKCVEIADTKQCTDEYEVNATMLQIGVVLALFSCAIFWGICFIFKPQMWGNEEWGSPQTKREEQEELEFAIQNGTPMEQDRDQDPDDGIEMTGGTGGPVAVTPDTPDGIVTNGGTTNGATRGALVEEDDIDQDRNDEKEDVALPQHAATAGAMVVRDETEDEVKETEEAVIISEDTETVDGDVADIDVNEENQSPEDEVQPQANEPEPEPEKEPEIESQPEIHQEQATETEPNPEPEPEVPPEVPPEAVSEPEQEPKTEVQEDDIMAALDNSQETGAGDTGATLGVPNGKGHKEDVSITMSLGSLNLEHDDLDIDGLFDDDVQISGTED